MANIVIMGAGIGGMPAAYEMRELLPKEHTVTVVSAMDFFQFVPSNPWVAVGWRKREEIVLKIAPLLERKGIQFIAKPVTTLDAAGTSWCCRVARLTSRCCRTTTSSSPPARS
jgi:sulfide:quinone oxidoreductase